MSRTSMVELATEIDELRFVRDSGGMVSALPYRSLAAMVREQESGLVADVSEDSACQHCGSSSCRLLLRKQRHHRYVNDAYLDRR